MHGAAETKEYSKSPLLIWPRWSGLDGFRHLLIVAYPLILSHAIGAFNMFMDRLFLSWYGPLEFSASLQAGTIFWAAIVIFIGTVLYAGTMGAQYIGAGKDHHVGAVIWQSIYFAIGGGVLFAALSPFSEWLFLAAGHTPEIAELEGQYLGILMIFGVFLMLNTALHSFFAAQSRTITIMFVNFAVAVLNICLNAWMIFEEIWIFPKGIEGAAWATGLSLAVGTVLFAIFCLADPKAERQYRLFSGWPLRPKLFRNFLHFGFPSGVHGLIDMIGFSSFILVVGLFGLRAQYASNMALNLNMLLFIPAVGIHMAMTIVAGQLAGGKNYFGAERMTTAGLVLIGGYMLLVSMIYIFLPETVLGPFRGRLLEDQWQSIMGLTKILLLYIIAYSAFDVLLLTYTGTLKGAGDTNFVMKISVVCSIFLMIIPVTLIGYFHEGIGSEQLGILLTWTCLFLFLMGLGTGAIVRYRSGVWKTIDIVEPEKEAPPDLSAEDHKKPSPAMGAGVGG